MNNQLEKEDAIDICNEYDLKFADVELDFEQANRYASEGRGDAETLFRGYLIDWQTERRCESLEAERNEERAYGSRDYD